MQCNLQQFFFNSPFSSSLQANSFCCQRITGGGIREASTINLSFSDGNTTITFTFYKGDEVKKNVTNDTYAMFLDEDIGLNDNGGYKCDARNNHSSGVKTSNILNVTVIGKSVSFFFLSNVIFRVLKQ